MAVSTHTSISLSIVLRYTLLALQFVSTLILARLLSPEEIGIYTAGFSIVALAHLFRDFGFNQYLIQEKELNSDKIETSFTLSILISWSLGTILFLSANLASQLVKEPQVALLVKLLSVNFFIIPFGAITLALLRKALKFHITSTLGFVSVICGVVVSIVSAYRGHSYFCLAYGALTETFLLATLAFFFREPGTSLKPNLNSWKEILAFGSLIGVTNIINQLSETVKSVALTRTMGASVLGYFSRAEGTTKLFNMIFVNAIKPVILPLYSKLNHDIRELRAAYYKTTSYAFALAWPFFGFLYFHTETVVLTLYGEQWGEAIDLVKVLCIGFMFAPPALFIDALLIANGTPKKNLQIATTVNVIQLTLVVIAATAQSVFFVCVAVATTIAIKSTISLIVLQKSIDLSLREIASVAAKNIPCLIFAVAPTVALDILLRQAELSMITRFIAMICLSGIGWLTALYLFKHELLDELLKLSKLKRSSNAA